MQTHFSDEQLKDPDIQVANQILRSCVHCGFCTATCPTYTLLGDELDSPRGRIYLIKQMLESGKPATEKVVKHIDRCLSCLSCMTTCPSGVHYMHLVDQARTHIEKTYQRPFTDKWLRRVLAFVLPNPKIFRLALMGAWLGKPLAPLMPAQLKAMLKLAPASGPNPPGELDKPQTIAAIGPKRGRVTMLMGCAQPVLAPEINEATVRLLTRLGIEVVIPKGAGCCGALTHHMGQEEPAHASAKANIDSWSAVGEFDAVIINASGCGTTVKDYGFMLRKDAAYAEKAAAISAKTLDIVEYLSQIGLGDAGQAEPLTVAYHSACSMQHGQQIKQEPLELLRAAGFKVKEVPEGHLCCGSAGTYNIMQPEIAGQLRDRKVANIERTRPDIISTGNIGCITQIRGGTDIPILHTVQLLDWATGGPRPAILQNQAPPATS